MTPVITAFLWDGSRILLAQRSEQVSTFPGHWAGISGYLEGDDPCSWALVELREETGASRERLTLRRAGEPLDAADEKSGKVFRVHPFLFSIDDPAGIRHDWEATRFEWVDVSELLERRRAPVVPRLYDAFELVWPPWPAERAFEENLALAARWLRQDREMGAGTLARAALGETIKLARLGEDEPSEKWRSMLRQAIDRLRGVRPSMAPPENLLRRARERLDAAASPEAFIAAARKLVEGSMDAERRVAELAAAQIAPGSKVMTISYSSSVLRTLLAAREKLNRVYVCEGRPLLEGRRLAESLHEAGIAVTLLTDAQAAALMPEVDRVLLGADALLPDGGAVNKVGSRLLALAAHALQRRVTVVAETLKRVRPESLDSSAKEFPLAEKNRPAENNPPAEKNPPAEVWSDAPQGIEISNLYFDVVPAELIDEIVTEENT